MQLQERLKQYFEKKPGHRKHLDNSDSRVTIATIPWYPTVTCHTLHTNVSSLTSLVLGYNSDICR